MIESPWYVTVLLALILLNGIISTVKSKLTNTLFCGISSVLSVLGLVGMVATRPYLQNRLSRGMENRNFEQEFVDWALEKFDVFAVVSITATCLLLAVLIFSLLRSKEHAGFVFRNTTGIVVLCMLFHVIASVWWGIGTINKMFDLGSFISLQAISGVFALYIPLIIKRIKVPKV